jgi:ATP-dependent Clp protease adapter protein ClpS
MSTVQVALSVPGADRDTRAVLDAARWRSAQRALPALTVRDLREVLLADDQVRAWWGPPESFPEGPVAAASSTVDTALLGLFAAATERARRQGRAKPPARTGLQRWGQLLGGLARAVGATVVSGDAALTRADLVHAFCGAASPPGLARLDAEDEVVPSVAGASGDRVCVVLDDDPTTPADAVFALLTALGLPEARAALVTMRVHHRGADRVVWVPAEAAAETLERWRAELARRALSLRVRVL